MRFDGVRFTVFNHENEPAFRRRQRVLSSHRQRRDAVGRHRGRGLDPPEAGDASVAFGAEEGLANAFVRVIFEDRKGSLWVGTDGGLFRCRTAPSRASTAATVCPR